MAFLPNIPQPTDQLSISQGNILNNFTILGAIAGNANPSSTSLNLTSGFNWLYLPPQGAIPPAGAAFTAGNIGMYSALNAATGFNELYINKTIAGPTVVQIPATAFRNNNVGATNGWTYLPSGLLIAWGTATIGATGLLTVNYAAALTNFPGFSTFWTCPQLTRIRLAAPATVANFVVVQAFGQTSFTAMTSTQPIAGTASIAWMVIGA